MLGASVLSG
nr:unnamed protein product [Callosobruchus chinensis]